MTDWMPVEPLVDAPEQRRYWREPEVGDRVQVRGVGECADVFWGVNGDGLEACGTAHSISEEGLLGTVIECPYIKESGFCERAAKGNAHTVVVWLDVPYDYNGVRFRGNHYAACELEPIE